MEHLAAYSKLQWQRVGKGPLAKHSQLTESLEAFAQEGFVVGPFDCKIVWKLVMLATALVDSVGDHGRG